MCIRDRFYDDSWIGVEPYGRNFHKFEFDGLIKCVFSGYEARLCSGVDVPTHELRLHPYLFPVGLGGAPTFMEGGNPTPVSYTHLSGWILYQTRLDSRSA